MVEANSRKPFWGTVEAKDMYFGNFRSQTIEKWFHQSAQHFQILGVFLAAVIVFDSFIEYLVNVLSTTYRYSRVGTLGSLEGCQKT